MADVYAPIRTGTDIAFLGGVINYLLANDKIQHEYVKSYTDVTLHRARRTSRSRTGSTPATTPKKRSYDTSSWDYELGEDGYVKTDPTLAASALRAAT